MHAAPTAPPEILKPITSFEAMNMMGKAMKTQIDLARMKVSSCNIQECFSLKSEEDTLAESKRLVSTFGINIKDIVQVSLLCVKLAEFANLDYYVTYNKSFEALSDSLFTPNGSSDFTVACRNLIRKQVLRICAPIQP